MKIVIASDSYKGTMTARRVSGILADAARRIFAGAEIITLPVSDGGEGLTDALIASNGGTVKTARAAMPNGGEIEAQYGELNGGSAVVELAAASSITYAPDPKDPMHASSYGTGELIRDAVASGAHTIILGLGGSACMDAAMGATAAMGVKYLDKDGNALAPNPLGLAQVDRISLDKVDPAFFNAEYELCIDVENKLCGKNGAAHVFGPQKGADLEQIEFIDAAHNRFARLLEEYSGKKILEEPGFGAAGGFALPFYALFNAKMKPGIDVMLDAAGFDDIIAGADLVITGEGKADFQSLSGKAPIGVARRAAAQNIPAVIIAGDAELNYSDVQKEGICAIFSINRRAVPYKDAKTTAETDLFETALSVFSLYKTALS